jgi:hypothetical protein
MSASYPSSAKSFTTKSNGSTIDASHINDLQDEVSAIETDLLTAFPGGGADGGQIKFPASQNASSDVNTLDDYEEGTWTPVLGGAGGTSGQTYSSQVGNYIKIGKKVWVQFFMVLTAKGTITGNLQIQGLPFTSVSSATAVSGADIAYFANMGSNIVKLSALTVTNSSVANVLLTTAAAASVSNGATANVLDTTEVAGSFEYIAAA